MPEINYLLREREFIKTDENIFKIGGTQQEMKARFNQYPKGSELIIYKDVTDCFKCESEIMKVFDLKFKNRRDIGREYYEGNRDEMIKEFVIITNKYVLSINNTIYNCIGCDYHTDKISHYNEHLKTEKHRSLFQKRTYVREYNLSFQSSSNLYTHKSMQKQTTDMTFTESLQIDPIIFLNKQNELFEFLKTMIKTDELSDKIVDNTMETKLITTTNPDKMYNEMKYSCEICNFHTYKKSHYNEHLKTKKHNSKIKRYNCPNCSASFAFNSGLYTYSKFHLESID